MRAGDATGNNSGGRAGGYGGGAYRGGDLNQGGYAPYGPYGQLTPEQRRAMDEEYRGIRQEAGELRELLGQDPEFGRLVGELVRDMQNLNWGNFQADPALLGRLQGEITDRWKDLELRLRRELQMEEPDSVRMATQERVPERYRAIVEEYYRSLSRSKPAQ
jgi:hypothetical protein